MRGVGFSKPSLFTVIAEFLFRASEIKISATSADRRFLKVVARKRANPAGAGGRGYFLARRCRAKKFRDDSDFFSRRKDKRGWIVPVGGLTPDRRN